MEVEGSAFLYTVATLLVTFAGFSALLLILRQAAGAHLSPLDRFLTRMIVGHLFVLTGGALLPPLFALYAVPEAWLWRSAAVLFGLPMLALLLCYRHRRIRATGAAPPLLIQAVFVWLGAAALIAMIAYVLAGYAHPAAAYATALTVNFLCHAYGFVTALEVIMRQPDEAMDDVRS